MSKNKLESVTIEDCQKMKGTLEYETYWKHIENVLRRHEAKKAELEIKKIEQRVAEHDIHFDISPEILRTKIIEVADPRMGARPIKRFVEQTCERLIAMKLLEEK